MSDKRLMFHTTCGEILNDDEMSYMYQQKNGQNNILERLILFRYINTGRVKLP